MWLFLPHFIWVMFRRDDFRDQKSMIVGPVEEYLPSSHRIFHLSQLLGSRNRGNIGETDLVRFVGASCRHVAHTSYLEQPARTHEGLHTRVWSGVQGYGKSLSRPFQVQVDQNPSSGTVPTEMELGGHEVS